MHFMVSISQELQSFLTIFQSDDPLFPFLHSEMLKMIQNIGKRFLREIVYTPKLDGYIKDISDINIGYGATEAIKKLKVVDIYQFKKECLTFLKELYLKLIQKFPYNNPVVKGSSCITPEIMLNQDKRENLIDLILTEFTESNVLDFHTADSIRHDYVSMCEDNNVIEYLTSYKRGDKLDDFLFKMSGIYPTSQNFLEFIKIIFTFFHSNAPVERSFSINGECLVDNLEEDTNCYSACL